MWPVQMRSPSRPMSPRTSRGRCGVFIRTWVIRVGRIWCVIFAWPGLRTRRSESRVPDLPARASAASAAWQDRTSPDFNQEVGIDAIFLYTVDKVKVTALSILDYASGFHIVAPVTGRKSHELAEDFLQAWVSWAGAPRRVVVDQERGMMKHFTEEMEKRGIQVHYIAAQAHWQNGAVERQNRWFRDIWEKVVAVGASMCVTG